MSDILFLREKDRSIWNSWRWFQIRKYVLFIDLELTLLGALEIPITPLGPIEG